MLAFFFFFFFWYELAFENMLAFYMEFFFIWRGGGDFLIKQRGFTHTRQTQHYLSPFSSDIEGLCIFSFLDSDSMIKELKIELPKYLATAENTSLQMDKLRNMSMISLTGPRHAGMF